MEVVGRIIQSPDDTVKVDHLLPTHELNRHASSEDFG